MSAEPGGTADSVAAAASRPRILRRLLSAAAPVSAWAAGRQGPLIAVAITAVTAVWVLTGTLPGDPPPASAAPTAPSASGAAAAPFAVRVAASVETPHSVTLRLSGRTEAERRVELKAETPAQVAAVPVDKGTRVKAGDLLIRLAEADRAALVEEARSLVRSRTLEYEAAARLQARGFQTENKAAAAAAALAEARGKLATAQVELERTRIQAPFAGILVAREVEPGAVVLAGDPLATLIDLDPLIVAAQATERQVAGIRTGDAAAIRFADGRQTEGRVRYVAAAGDKETRTFRIEVAVANPEDRDGGPIVEGLSADVLLSLASVPAHRLPRSALTLDDLGRVGVKIATSEDKVAFMPVTPIADAEDGIWLSGLPSTARVITVGHEMVAAGQSVRVVEATGAADAR